MNKLLWVAVLSWCCALSTAFAQGTQAYPSKPIRLIVPFPPGGSTDTMARTFAQKLSDSLGQPVVVDNKPGAGGNIGLDIAAKAPADGYTIVMGSTGTLAVNPSLYKSLPFDPDRDLAPVALLAYVSNILTVNPKVPAKTVQELIQLLKANPGKYNFASPGNGNSSHLAGEIFKIDAGVDMVHVPYKGDVPAITDLIGGQVQIMFITAGTAAPYVKDGRLRALAAASSKRLPTMPGLPTIAESGIPGFDASAWFGISTRAGVPASIVDRLNRELNKIIRDPEIQKRLESLSATPGGGSPQDYGAFIASERAKWGKAVRQAGLSLG